MRKLRQPARKDRIRYSQQLTRAASNHRAHLVRCHVSAHVVFVHISFSSAQIKAAFSLYLSLSHTHRLTHAHTQSLTHSLTLLLESNTELEDVPVRL